MAERKSIMLYLDALEQWDMLTDEQAGVLIKALLRYSKTGEQLESTDGMVKMAFSFMSAQIDRDGAKWERTCEKRREAIKKRWGLNTNEYNSIQMNTKDTDTDTVKDTEKDTDTEKDITLSSNNIYKPLKPQKHKYGEYQHVLLTDDEHSRLVSDFGSDVTDRYIKKVDEYCEQSGKTYKNYNLAIRNTFMSRDNVKPKEQKRDIFSLPDEQLTEQERIIKKLRC